MKLLDCYGNIFRMYLIFLLTVPVKHIIYRENKTFVQLHVKLLYNQLHVPEEMLNQFLN